MEPVRRARAALYGYGYWHLPMLLGIVAIAAAERSALAHPFSEAGWRVSALLAGGVAAFLTGDVLFRRELAIARSALRAGAAALALATMPLGALACPAAQIGALVLLLVLAVVLEKGSA